MPEGFQADFEPKFNKALIYIQIVFAVEGRQNLISRQQREELHKYITGIVQNREQKMLSILQTVRALRELKEMSYPPMVNCDLQLS